VYVCMCVCLCVCVCRCGGVVTHVDWVVKYFWSPLLLLTLQLAYCAVLQTPIQLEQGKHSSSSVMLTFDQCVSTGRLTRSQSNVHCCTAGCRSQHTQPCGQQTYAQKHVTRTQTPVLCSRANVLHPPLIPLMEALANCLEHKDSWHNYTYQHSTTPTNTQTHTHTQTRAPLQIRRPNLLRPHCAHAHLIQ
jgi:hypothetical protein